MESLSFAQKLGILFKNLFNHPLFFCILVLPIVYIFLNKKITKKIIVLVYIIILAFILFIGNTTIFSLFDNLVDGIFMALYFPNFITLFIVEVTSALITLVTFLKKDMTKSKKIINLISFIVIQALFGLIITNVQVNDINIYEENALYGNDDVLTLMQLLMGTFGLQIIILLVITGIDKVTQKLDYKENDKIKRIVHVDAAEKLDLDISDKFVKLETKSAKPLEKNLFIQEHVEPINIDDIIEKEYIEKQNMFPKIQAENLYIKQKDDKEIKEKKFVNSKPDLLKPELIGKKERKDVLWVPKGVSYQPNKKSEIPIASSLSFDDFKLEFPDNKRQETIISPIIKNNKDSLKDVNKEKKLLVNNLVIVDFEKTVNIIKNLTAVYTL